MIFDHKATPFDKAYFVTSFTRQLLASGIKEKKFAGASIQAIFPSNKETTSLIQSIDLSWEPELSEEGSSGVYFLKDANGNNVAVFKPLDEEPGAARNPRSDTSAIPPNFTPGLGFLNEYAAYEMDQSMGEAAAGIPHTCVVAVDWIWNHQAAPTVKFGSLQKFVVGEDACDYGSGCFSKLNVQKIALLDIRILNCDRHFSNLLVCKDSGQLTPIDHGYSFPSASNQLDLPSFDWLLWPQTKEETAEEILDAIEKIDIQKDMKKLAMLGMSDDSIISFWMSNALLKIGSAYGFTLHQIGSLIQRLSNRSEPSALEILFKDAYQKFVEDKWNTNFTNEFKKCAMEYLNASISH